jgi:hypothetical protein
MILNKLNMNMKGKSWRGAKALVFSAFAPFC